eukprot:714295-Pyramimonas_sp.AAC.1
MDDSAESLQRRRGGGYPRDHASNAGGQTPEDAYMPSYQTDIAPTNATGTHATLDNAPTVEIPAAGVGP